MEPTELDQQILAEGEKVRLAARRGALEARRSTLVEELTRIDAELAGPCSCSDKEACSECPPEAAPEPAEASQPVAEETPASSPEAPEKPAEEPVEAPAPKKASGRKAKTEGI